MPRSTSRTTASRPSLPPPPRRRGGDDRPRAIGPARLCRGAQSRSMRTAARTWSSVNGFIKTPSRAALMDLARSSSSGKPDMRSTLRLGATSIARSVSAIPSTPGMCTSVTRSSTAPGAALSLSRASVPSCVASTRWPSDSSARLTKSRVAPSSSANRMRAISRLRDVPLPNAARAGPASLLHDSPDVRQFPVPVRGIHTVAHDELVGTLESAKIGGDVDRAENLLVEQHATPDLARPAGGDQVPGKGERAARIEHVVDQEHVAPLDGEVEVAQDLDFAR